MLLLSRLYPCVVYSACLPRGLLPTRYLTAVFEHFALAIPEPPPYVTVLINYTNSILLLSSNRSSYYRFCILFASLFHSRLQPYIRLQLLSGPVHPKTTLICTCEHYGIRTGRSPTRFFRLPTSTESVFFQAISHRGASPLLSGASASLLPTRL